MKHYKKKSYLRHEYLDLKRSCQSSAFECSCDPKTIWRWLRIHGIPTRGLRGSRESVEVKKKLTEEQKAQRRLELLKGADTLMKEGRALLKESRLSPTEREQLRIQENYSRKKKEEDELRRKIKEEQRRDTSWNIGRADEQLAEITQEHEESIIKE